MPNEENTNLTAYGEHYTTHPYYALLTDIYDRTIALEVQKSLLSVNLFKIDLDARKIIAPSDYLDFFGVVGEHKAETITFQCDRFYEDVDLAQMTIVVEYVNANGEGRVSPIILRDSSSIDGQILFDWIVDADLYSAPGEIQFAVRFFMVGDSDSHSLNRTLVYSLRTRPFTSKVLNSLPLNLDAFEETYRDQFADNIDALLGANAALERKINEKKFYWIDIT